MTDRGGWLIQALPSMDRQSDTNSAPETDVTTATSLHVYNISSATAHWLNATLSAHNGNFDDMRGNLTTTQTLLGCLCANTVETWGLASRYDDGPGVLERAAIVTLVSIAVTLFSKTFVRACLLVLSHWISEVKDAVSRVLSSARSRFMRNSVAAAPTAEELPTLEDSSITTSPDLSPEVFESTQSPPGSEQQQLRQIPVTDPAIHQMTVPKFNTMERPHDLIPAGNETVEIEVQESSVSNVGGTQTIQLPVRSRNPDNSIDLEDQQSTSESVARPETSDDAAGHSIWGRLGLIQEVVGLLLMLAKTASAIYQTWAHVHKSINDLSLISSDETCRFLFVSNIMFYEEIMLYAMVSLTSLTDMVHLTLLVLFQLPVCCAVGCYTCCMNCKLWCAWNPPSLCCCFKIFYQMLCTDSTGIVFGFMVLALFLACIVALGVLANMPVVAVYATAAVALFWLLQKLGKHRSSHTDWMEAMFKTPVEYRHLCQPGYNLEDILLMAAVIPVIGFLILTAFNLCSSMKVNSLITTLALDKEHCKLRTAFEDAAGEADVPLSVLYTALVGTAAQLRGMWALVVRLAKAMFSMTKYLYLEHWAIAWNKFHAWYRGFWPALLQLANTVKTWILTMFDTDVDFSHFFDAFLQWGIFTDIILLLGK